MLWMREISCLQMRKVMLWIREISCLQMRMIRPNIAWYIRQSSCSGFLMLALT